ncbi:MAG TPA: glycosyltransferase family 2 protein [Candidatus Polarisedimenticolia bacterium]|jgi:GT2 family glycosyltransferase
MSATGAVGELVSVIVLSWNSREFLDGCLTSVMRQTWPAVELIVVDNGSTDGSPQLVRERFPSALLVENAGNLGFCAGNNVGLRRSHGAHVLFLNADATLDTGYIEKALEPFAEDPRVGMVAGKVLRFDRRTLDTTGQILKLNRRVMERGYGEEDRGQYEQPGEVFSVCGAAALYRREAIDDISMDGEFFDEDFFAFGEDLDAGWRARTMGWLCRYQPAAVAAHYRGGTQTARRDGAGRHREMTRRPPHIQAHIVKNRWLAILKNEAPGSFLAHLPFILAWDLVIWLYLLIFSPTTVPILWGHRRLLGRALGKRRAIRSRAALRAAARV